MFHSLISGSSSFDGFTLFLRSPVHDAEAPGGQTQHVLRLPACSHRPAGPPGSCQSSSGRAHHLPYMALLLLCPQNRLETSKSTTHMQLMQARNACYKQEIWSEERLFNSWNIQYKPYGCIKRVSLRSGHPRAALSAYAGFSVIAAFEPTHPPAECDTCR